MVLGGPRRCGRTTSDGEECRPDPALAGARLADVLDERGRDQAARGGDVGCGTRPIMSQQGICSPSRYLLQEPCLYRRRGETVRLTFQPFTQSQRGRQQGIGKRQGPFVYQLPIALWNVGAV